MNSPEPFRNPESSADEERFPPTKKVRDVQKIAFIESADDILREEYEEDEERKNDVDPAQALAQLKEDLRDDPDGQAMLGILEAADQEDLAMTQAGMSREQINEFRVRRCEIAKKLSAFARYVQTLSAPGHGGLDV